MDRIHGMEAASALNPMLSFSKRAARLSLVAMLDMREMEMRFAGPVSYEW